MRLAVLALFLASPAAAQVAPACTGGVKPPPELASWTTPKPLTAARSVRELGLATLSPGQAARAALTGTPRLTFAIPPEHRAAAATNGGLFAFTVTQAGAYRVALGAAVWIDVVANGQAVASSAHGHGPACSGIRKQVDFALQPGRYVLQVSGASDPALTLMVTRLPA